MPLPTLAHVSLGTNDFPRAKAFYDALLATIGVRVLMQGEHSAGYGRKHPDFWIQQPYDGNPATAGNGVHMCFLAATQQEVQAFHAKALKLGGTDDGAPGFRPQYFAEYYAAFVRDLDGNKLEVMVAV